MQCKPPSVSDGGNSPSSTLAGLRQVTAAAILATGLLAQGCGGAAPDESHPGESNPNGTGGSSSAGNPSGIGGSNQPGNPGPGNPSNPAGPDGGAGTPDAASADSGSTPVPGVAVGGMCVPLCMNASTDPDGDGWGFETVSCVVPGRSVAMESLPCQVGGPVPSGPAAGTAGVAVDGVCLAFCGANITDPDGDGYGFQFDASCIMPQSNVAAISLPCTIGGAVPAGSFPQGTAGRLLSEVCTPFCTTPRADPDGDGYGFQYGVDCLVTGSAAALQGLDCKIGVPEPLGLPIVLNPNPPPGQIAKPAAVRSRGFFVSGARLYDKFGNDFIMRGINNAHIWFDASDQYLAYAALDNLAAHGTNAIRVVWETTGTAVLLRRILRHIVELKMIPMVELHDATSNTDNARLLDMASYYAGADVKQVLLDYEDFLLVNIANEWSGTDYRNAYVAAISLLRTSGINHTLVIDANGAGQNAAAIFTDGAALLAADPQHNLVFSVHMYDTYAAARGGGPASITQTLEQAVSMGLPLVIGEFGWQAGNPPVPIDAQFIMSECARLRIGYFPWSWKGNDPTLSYLDMSIDWEGMQLNPWGAQIFQAPSGIVPATPRASIFSL